MLFFAGIPFLFEGAIIGIICWLLAAMIGLVLFTPLRGWLGIPTFGASAPPTPSKPTTTFHGGTLGGSADLDVRSSADHLTYDTDIGDRVRLRAEHHPVPRLDSKDESLPKTDSPEEQGSTSRERR